MQVVFLDSVHPVLQERLEALQHECIDGTSFDLAYCKQHLTSVEGIVIRSRFPMDEDFLSTLPNLKFIARSGAGMENIDEDYCASRGIILFNAPEGNRNAVAEHALGMLLSLFNHLNRGDREVRSGVWRREANRGLELDGKTVGIIGYGNNGSAFAKKLRGFDVRVLVFDKYKTGLSNANVEQVSLEELYREADVISFHIPQNEETKYWADKTFFESVFKPFFLLNLSRGKIVRTAALMEALEAGKVLGAGLDVLEFEKASFENMFDGEMDPSFQQLLASDKVLLSPHVGGWTQESYYKLSAVLADKIESHYH